MIAHGDVAQGRNFPSIRPYRKRPKTNPDGSADLRTGPQAPQGMEADWIRTT
jgi:hypothetical protein